MTTSSDIHPRPLGPFCTSGVIAPRVIPVLPSLPVFSSNNIQIPVQFQCFEMHQISQFSKPHHVAFWEESIVHPGVNHEVKHFGTANALIKHENEVEGFHVKMRIVRTSLVCFFETFAGHFEWINHVRRWLWKLSLISIRCNDVLIRFFFGCYSTFIKEFINKRISIPTLNQFIFDVSALNVPSSFIAKTNFNLFRNFKKQL